ncbi:MAG: hypothetical protein AAGF55_00745 [Pseudomonadota bacterium]
MSLITDATTSWSDPVTLTSDEVWQTRDGSVFVTTSANPTANDGISIYETHAVRFSAGLSVRYRKEGSAGAVIVREAV